MFDTSVEVVMIEIPSFPKRRFLFAEGGPVPTLLLWEVSAKIRMDFRRILRSLLEFCM